MNLTVERTDTIITLTANELEAPDEVLQRTLGDIRPTINTPRVHIRLEGQQLSLNSISTILLFIVELRRAKIRAYLRAAPETLASLRMMGMATFFESDMV